MSENWRQQAKCKGMPLSTFYGGSTDTVAEVHKTVAAAKRLCKGKEDGDPCPVIDECGAAAMKEEESQICMRFGVRGGMSPTDRSRKASPAWAERKRLLDQRYKRLSKQPQACSTSEP